MDISRPYQAGVRENCRNAQVVFDKFHVIFNANRAVEQVRKAEIRRGGTGVWDALRRRQWIWRKKPENLTGPQRAHLAKIHDKNLATATAYQMRLVLQDIYRSPDVQSARHRFQVWCRWVRWVARSDKRGLFASMRKLERTIQHHLTGILAHWKWGLTNAFMEGLNSVFSATKRRARGYRSTPHLITMLYFVARKLRLLNSNSTGNSEEPVTLKMGRVGVQLTLFRPSRAAPIVGDGEALAWRFHSFLALVRM